MEGRKTISNEQCDVTLFKGFLFNSFSEHFPYLFLHGFVINEEKLYETDEDIKRKYFAQLPIYNMYIYIIYILLIYFQKNWLALTPYFLS